MKIIATARHAKQTTKKANSGNGKLTIISLLEFIGTGIHEHSFWRKCIDQECVSEVLLWGFMIIIQDFEAGKNWLACI